MKRNIICILTVLMLPLLFASCGESSTKPQTPDHDAAEDAAIK